MAITRAFLNSRTRLSTSDNSILELADDVTQNTTNTTGKNAFSVGPLTIASGVTLTIPSGQVHVIL